jgi:hypothetical protein
MIYGLGTYASLVANTLFPRASAPGNNDNVVGDIK